MRMLRKIFRYIRALVQDFQPDLIAAYTASTAWFIMLSFLPFVIMLLSLLRFLPFSTEDLSLLEFEFAPPVIRELLRSVVGEVTQNTSAYVLPIAAFSGLLSASTGFDSLIKGLNVVFDRKETRSFLKTRVICVLYTVAFLLVIVTVLAGLVFGRMIYNNLANVAPFMIRMIDWRFLSAFLILTLFFTLLYKTVPNHKMKWFAEIPGAFISAGMWLAFSHLYSLYISSVERFSKIYGSVTVLILFMVWLYACIFIVYIGAYANKMLYKHIASKLFLKSNIQ